MKKIKSKATPQEKTEEIQSGELPKYLQQFEGTTPTQIVETLFPRANIEAIAPVFCGLGFDLGIPVPEWAKKASKQFWKYFFGNKFDANLTSDFGVLAGMVDHLPVGKEPSPENPFMNLLPAMMEQFEKQIRTLSPKETADYYVGRAKADGVIEKVKNPDYLKMVKRAPIYLVIAAGWKMFESFESQAEAERWLRSQKIIGDNVDSREIRAVFSNVGLRYRGQGRPKKPKTDVSNP
jgi:hypothetical protein